MNDDVRRVIYGTVAGFLAVVVGWVGFIYLNACGFTFSCNRADPLVVRTPIPTLIPVEHGSAQMPPAANSEFDQCLVAANDLVGAWVSAGVPESEAFPFIALNGQACEGTFSEDIQPLFVENSLWENRIIGCVSCHNAELTDRSGGLDLTAYDAILQGAGRVDANAAGSDIFGSGSWESSSLHNVLVNQGLVATGHSPDSPPNTLVVYAGRVGEPTATPTP